MSGKVDLAGVKYIQGCPQKEQKEVGTRIHQKLLLAVSHEELTKFALIYGDLEGDFALLRGASAASLSRYWLRELEGSSPMDS